MSVFIDGAAKPLVDRDYYEFVLAAVEGARRRVWISVFLFDLRPSRDVAGLVMELTAALVQRHSVGVDVRVLVSAQVSTPDIAVANRATGLFLQQYKVPSRHAFGDTSGGRRGYHTKLVVFDEVAVLGSQNWTDDAFRLNVEDAVILTGLPVETLAAQFQAMWHSGRAVST